MENLASIFGQMGAQEIQNAVREYWIIPAGMITLYFYGISHFNTPEYRLVILQSPDTSALLTMAPPSYTTSKARFRRYALRYVLILISIFLIFVFLTPVVAQIVHLLFNAHLEETATPLSKAIFALFCLTGLLSSFPGFKEIDAWMLSKLHRAALIPDDAKLMASRLFDADYDPPKKTRDQVRGLLKARDTIRCAEGKVSGSLEARVLATLWLHTQLGEKTKETDRAYFTSKFEIDLTDIAKSSTRLRTELLAYFKEQERLLPTTETDIDQFFALETNEDVLSLGMLRKDLLERCEALYHRMCLLTSVLVYSTEDTAEEIDRFLTSLGFAVRVQDTLIMDWDTVFRVVGSVFVLMLAANAAFMAILNIVGAPSTFSPDRSRLLIFAASTTLQYFVVVYAALKIKRRWRRSERPHKEPENPMIAIVCYTLTLPISIALSIWARHGEISFAPVLYAASYGIVGYFIGSYIDRSLANKRFSWKQVELQAGVQFCAALLIFFFAPPPRGVEFSPLQQLTFASFFAFQSGLAGFLVGSLFQYFYRRADPAQSPAIGDITVQLQPSPPALP